MTIKVACLYAHQLGQSSKPSHEAAVRQQQTIFDRQGQPRFQGGDSSPENLTNEILSIDRSNTMLRHLAFRQLEHYAGRPNTGRKTLYFQ